jgi:hypothetical protein
MADLETIGVFRVPLPDDPGTMRRLSPGEPVTDSTYVFITDPQRALQLVVENSEARVEALEGWDDFYPHDAELATDLFTWYELLFAYTSDPVSKKRYAVEAERWAKASTDRSPKVAWFWVNYAKALWMRGRLEPGPQGLAYYFTGLDYYRRAHELFPAEGAIAFYYGQALKNLGDALIKAGRADDGRRLLSESQTMFGKAELLANYDSLIR